MNVVVFGETGSGKSSLVNLLLGKNAAKVSDSAVGCTFKFEKYSNECLTLFDTVGLSEGGQGTVKPSEAVKNLINLLRSLEEGISLLIFVMKQGRITKTLDENYKLFVDVICMKNIPVVLAITNCETNSTPDQWWIQNQKTFTEIYSWKIAAAVSCCCLHPDSAPPFMKQGIKELNESTKTQLLNTIQDKKLDKGYVVPGGWRNWFQRIANGIFPFLSKMYWKHNNEPVFPNLALASEQEQRLKRYFVDHGLPAETADSMTSEIMSWK